MKDNLFEFSLQLQREQIENYKKSLVDGVYDNKLSHLIQKYNEFVVEARRSGYRVGDSIPVVLPSDVGVKEDEGRVPFNEIWKEEPKGIEEFVVGEGYLNLGGMVYKNIMALAKEWARPEIREGWALLGKGSGKTTLTAIMLIYSMYKLLCLRDWRSHLKIPIGEIAILNLSTSLVQAQRVMFTKIKNMFARSKWFSKCNYNVLKREIDFGDDRYLFSGHSGSSAWVGYSVLAGVLDEADFLLDRQEQSNAQELYDLLISQAKTRFKEDYKVFVISSLGGENSFMHRKLKRMKKSGDSRKGIIVAY